MRVRTEWGSLHARRVVIGTNAHSGVLKRFGAWVLPVYDHVLMTEPLTAAQLDAIGWQGREGLTDAGNQFHYYRRTLDDRMLFGGYDANYHFPGRIDPALEQSDASHGLLADHFFDDLPPARRHAVHPPVGRRHRHDVPVHAGLRHRPLWPDGLCRRLHRARCRVDALRGARRARPGRRPGHRGDPAADGAAKADPLPSRADPSMPPCGRRGRRSQPRTAAASATCGSRPSTRSASASTPDLAFWPLSSQNEGPSGQRAVRSRGRWLKRLDPVGGDRDDVLDAGAPPARGRRCTGLDENVMPASSTRSLPATM